MDVQRRLCGNGAHGKSPAARSGTRFTRRRTRPHLTLTDSCTGVGTGTVAGETACVQAVLSAARCADVTALPISLSFQDTFAKNLLLRKGLQEQQIPHVKLFGMTGSGCASYALQVGYRLLSNCRVNRRPHINTQALARLAAQKNARVRASA